MLDGAPAMRPGRSSHTQVAGFPNACTQLNSWHSRSCLRLRSNSFHLEAAHITPNPLKKESGGHHCLVYICSKQENMHRFDSQKIRQLFQSARVFSPSFSLCWSRNTTSFILCYFHDVTQYRAVYFREASSGESPMIYVMFSVPADLYLNDNPEEQ